MDEAHLWEAVRYVSLNPVRAGLVKRAADWPWSSVRDHVDGRSFRAFDAHAVLDRVGDFRHYLAQGDDDAKWQALRASETSGRPLGTASFVEDIEIKTGLSLLPQRRGPKPKMRQI